MKRIFILICTLLLCVNFASAKTHKITDAKDIAVKKGDKIIITLTENRTTGYMWKIEIRTITEPACLKEKSSKFIAPKTKTAMVGVAGKHEYIVKAVQRGQGQVVGIYSRPWEKQVYKPDYILNVIVE